MSPEDRLQNLLTITDTTLGRLDVEDLLVELLDRICTVLDADTAAVLLRDGGPHLAARAARGLEDEVRQGVRVPIGVGFAGRIAATRSPVFLDRVDSTTVANPILWEKGIRKMLGVPLLSNDGLLGVLHIGRLDDRPFTQEDAEVLQVAAERVAGATQARQLAVETAAARLLEQSLMPTYLPALPGLELAARYVPTESRLIGGDWYDAFTLPSGELWLVTGDVAGHGLRAAVVMGRIKSALRSYALFGGTPGEVLQQTDRKVRHFEPGATATVVCAVATAPYRRFEICSAGHPPPVLAQIDGRAEFVDVRPGPPLGVLADARRESTTVEVPDGAVLALYTDGLIERRDQSLDDSLEQLRGVVAAEHPEAVCQRVMHKLIGSTPAGDDIAILVLRRTGPGPG
jgi:serine phosphatase RsbU (regulator of sigma subunit)